MGAIVLEIRELGKPERSNKSRGRGDGGGEQVMVIFVKDKERQIRDEFYCNAPLDV